MAFQLEPGMAPRHPTADRLFFAVFPDAKTAERIAGLAESLRKANGLRGRLIPAGRLHITLHHLGDHHGVPEELVARAMEAGRGLDASRSDVTLSYASSFQGKPRNFPFVLRGNDEQLAALQDLQKALGQRLDAQGLAMYAKDRYTPHLTLLYGDKRIDEQAIDPVTWTVHEIVLMHSLLGQGLHRPLGRWSLGSG